MTKRTQAKRPYDVRVTVLGVTWATSPEEAIELTESELSACGFPPSEDQQSVAVESEARCGVVACLTPGERGPYGEIRTAREAAARIRAALSRRTGDSL